MSLTSITKTSITVIVQDKYGTEISVYKGDCPDEAEKAEACLEMCIDIAEIFTNPSAPDVAEIWEVLEKNGHTPD